MIDCFLSLLIWDLYSRLVFVSRILRKPSINASDVFLSVVFDINRRILLVFFNELIIDANPDIKKYPTAILALSVLGNIL